MGGWSPEAPISMRSGKNAFKTLDREKYNVRAVILKEDRTACFLGEDETPKEEDWKDRPSENISKVFTEVLAWPVDAALLALHGCGTFADCYCAVNRDLYTVGIRNKYRDGIVVERIVTRLVDVRRLIATHHNEGCKRRHD